MNRYLLGAIPLLALMAAVLPARAATTTPASFNVTATLTSKCEVTTSAATNVAFTYTSFQTSAAAATGTFDVRCTNTLPYTLAVAATTGTVIGLAYTLSVPSTTFTGSGSNASHTITGGMIAGQAGTCAVSATTCTGTNVHTVTVTY